MDKDDALKFPGKIIPKSHSDPIGKNESAQAVARLIIVRNIVLGSSTFRVELFGFFSEDRHP